MSDTKAIRAAAEAAPKEMLHVRHDFDEYYSLRHYPGGYYQGRVRGKEWANFIATANPATILALLDRLEAAEKDAALLDFIQANAEGRLLRKYKKRWSFEPVCSNYEYPVFQSLRDALDYAMKEQK